MRAMNRFQWLAKLACLIPSSPKQRAKVTGREPRDFSFNVEGVRHSVSALTRSEARALLKHELKLKRLPVGA
jgi:hypothetical protein